jgi:hypothetical protein
MAKDKRYNTAKKLIEMGAMKSISEILDVIPKTVIGLDMRMHHDTFKRLLSNPGNFTLNQIFQLASLIGVDKMTMLNLILQEISLGDSKRKK